MQPIRQSETNTLPPPLLRLDGVAVRFTGPRDVLSRTSLTVRPGEFVTLLGPSGCGKSTLLNLTAGTLRPREGSIHFDGKLVVAVNQGVGYVTQEDTMLPWLSLAANVGLPLRMRRVRRAEAHERVMALLTSFGASRGSLAVSGAAFRRHEETWPARAGADLSAASAADGRTVRGLGCAVAGQLQRDLRHIVIETGIAVLFVTHDLEEAALLPTALSSSAGRRGTSSTKSRSTWVRSAMRRRCDMTIHFGISAACCKRPCIVHGESCHEQRSR